MKMVSILMIVVALIAGMAGCGPAPITQYDLTVSSTDGGSVTTPGEGIFAYDESTVASLVAVPASGYWFAAWAGDVDTAVNVHAASTTITMNGDYTITARFESILPAQCSLTIYGTTGGSVTTPGQGAFTYDRGTVVSLVAEAEEGYGFAEWIGNVDSIADVHSRSTTITMNSNSVITASFQPDWIQNPANGHYYALTPYLTWTGAEAWAQARGGHLVTLRNWEEELWIKDTFGRHEYFWIGLSDIEEEGKWVWSSGEPVVYTNWAEGEPNNCAWPGCYPEDEAIMNWNAGDPLPQGYGNYWNDILKTSCRGVAEMVPDYILIISSTDGGSVITPGEGEFTFEKGTAVYLEARPDEGYEFVEWTGDVDTIADVRATSTTIMMGDDYSIKATFQAVGECFITAAACGTPIAGQAQIPLSSDTNACSPTHSAKPV